MAAQVLDTATLTVLAETAARRLAKTAITNLELREALHTTKTSNGVRIGGCEIRYQVEGDKRIYEVSFGETECEVVEGLAFYETARHLVRLFNDGHRLGSASVKHLVRTNEEYVRVRDRARLHGERFSHYEDIGDGFRADLNENKLSRDLARLEVLRHRLLEGLRATTNYASGLSV